MVLIECCECGINFAVSKDFNYNLHKNKQSFCCPNGHSQSYRESTAEILQKKLDSEKETSSMWLRQVDEKDMYIEKLERKLKRNKIKL